MRIASTIAGAALVATLVVACAEPAPSDFGSTGGEPEVDSQIEAKPAALTAEKAALARWSAAGPQQDRTIPHSPVVNQHSSSGPTCAAAASQSAPN